MMKIPITRRKNHAAYHDTLDPYEDRAVIFEQIFTREFPMEFFLATEIAQLRSFTVPNGTKLLHRTGEFEKNSVKRLDDTRAILAEMGRDGFDSPRAAEMSAHLNQIHGFYDIPNHEFVYTLSTFIFDPWLFINKYGWRKLTRNEELALYHTYCDMGALMNIHDIPASFDEFWAWRQAYEAEHQAFAEENYLVAEGLFRGIYEMVPAVARPFVKPFTLSLENKRFAHLLGYDYPHSVVRSMVQAVMWIRKQFLKWFTIWDTYSFEEFLLSNFKTYPNGYNRMRLGPAKLIRHMRKQQTD